MRALLVLLLSACGADVRLPRGTGGVSLISIVVTPASPSLSAGDAQQMVATGVYIDDSELNLTSAAVWVSSDTGVATITSGTGGGVMSTVGAGTTTITATVGAVSGQTSVEVVTDEDAPEVTSYAPDSGQIGDFVTITGLRFTGVTDVSFNGTAASFVFIDDETIVATVPSGATTGTISVTTPDGADTGPSFTVTANAFAFNLDSETLPAGLTGTRTGDPMYLARTLGTEAVEETGSDVYEQREDGAGQWTFPAYANSIASPNNFGGADWTPYNSPVMTTGQTDPTGGSNATKIADNQAGTVAAIYGVSTDTGYDPTVSVWVRDDATDPPTGSGIITASDGGGGAPAGYCGFLTCQDLSTGTGWKRRHSKLGSSGSASYLRPLISPAGQTPVYNAYATQAPSAVGARHFWGAMAMGGTAPGYPGFDAPTLFGSTGARVIRADDPEDAIDGNGDLDIEGRFVLPDITGSQTMSERRVVTINGPSGITRLFLDTGISWYMAVNNGTPFGQSITYGRQGQIIAWRMWHKPTENSFGWAVRFNGAIAMVDVYPTPVGSIGTPTDAVLGASESDDKILPAMHGLWRRSARPIATVYDAEGVVLGDSTMAPYSGSYLMVASAIYEGTEAKTRLGILSLATTAESAVQQLGRWQASSARGNSDVAWVSVQVGINDIAGGASESTVRTRIQNIVDDINTQNPTAKVIVVPMTPASGAFDAGKLAIWNAINTSITGGASPITGSNLVRMAVWTELDDGTGALKSIYDIGDGIHENDDARYYMASQYRATLVAEGLL